MDEQTKAAIKKRIAKGVPFITIQGAFGVSDDELKKLAGLAPKKNKKKEGRSNKASLIIK